MTILIIIAGFLFLFGLLLAASIKVRFNFDESEKALRVSYTLMSLMLDFREKKGKVAFAGLPLKKLDLKSRKKAAPPTEKKLRKGKKAKKKRSFGLSFLKMKYLRMVKPLLSGIRIRKLMVKISGGFMEPFNTGKMYGYYWAARGICPKLMSHVVFRPDFSSEHLAFEGKGLVSLRMFYIFRFVFAILADMTKEKIAGLFVIRKRGECYG